MTKRKPEPRMPEAQAEAIISALTNWPRGNAVREEDALRYMDKNDHVFSTTFLKIIGNKSMPVVYNGEPAIFEAEIPDSLANDEPGELCYLPEEKPYIPHFSINADNQRLAHIDARTVVLPKNGASLNKLAEKYAVEKCRPVGPNSLFNQYGKIYQGLVRSKKIDV